MRRTEFKVAATLIAVAVVFAPRPQSGTPERSGEGDGALASRVLAPTFDVVELREPLPSKQTSGPSRALWVLTLIAFFVAPARRLFLALRSPRVTFLSSSVESRSSRAPPLVLI